MKKTPVFDDNTNRAQTMLGFIVDSGVSSDSIKVALDNMVVNTSSLTGKPFTEANDQYFTSAIDSLIAAKDAGRISAKQAAVEVKTLVEFKKARDMISAQTRIDAVEISVAKLTAKITAMLG